MIFIKKYILIILFLLPISISSFKKTTFFNNELLKPIIVHLNDINIYLDLEDYVFGVVSAEMPASFNDEALKAQAVASRSFALSKKKGNLIELSSTISDQVYHPNYELKQKWGNKYQEYFNKILDDIKSTEGYVISRNNKVLKAYYFSMSNGYTENSETVFKENTFISVESPYEKGLDNFEIKKEFAEDELLKLLNVPKIIINEVKRNNTNHVDYIVISNKKYLGTEFRKLLNLRSTDFTLEKNNNIYVITTRGYGHGVGMSQYGANLMAKNGATYKEILHHYYQNTQIIKI